MSLEPPKKTFGNRQIHIIAGKNLIDHPGPVDSATHHRGVTQWGTRSVAESYGYKVLCVEHWSFKSSLIKNIAKTCYDRRAMESSPDLLGQIVYLPGGVKVKVESIEGDPPRAVARRVDGPLAGNIAICQVSKLEPLAAESRKGCGRENSDRLAQFERRHD